ncbi:MAG TPA: DinB family protein [Thermoanaerobaculia bacterium]|nr:DinB family protein [Thermoanaerobaculia bacterium]
MRLDEIRDLFSYTEWANDEVIAAIRPMPDEQYAFVRDTLAHIIFAEWVWLRRWKGESPTAPPAWAEHAPPLDALVDHLHDVEAERRALLDSLSDDDLERDVAYRSLKGDPFTNGLGHQMQHVVNHSTYHRGQVVMKIRQMGIQPPSTDLIVWFRKMSQVS